MKKVILGVATLLLVGGVYAQSGANTANLSEVDQSGANINNTVDQISFSALVNYSDLNQSGANYADIDQIGANDSYVTQTGSNIANVHQEGGGGIHTGTANYQVSHINQTGQNSAYVIQWGDGNDSDIDQVNAPGELPNYAEVNQGTFNHDSSDNMSTINQLSNFNYVRHFQDGDNNVADTNQDSTGGSSGTIYGFYQVALTQQGGDLNWADVNQTGNDNISSVYQFAYGPGTMGDPYTNEATIVQDGEHNLSNLHQEDLFSGDANNTAMVTQTNLVSGPGNTSDKNQVGANTVVVTQTNL
ncbi:hypothetical protein [Ulvibacter litoralis]|uniref:Curlin associated repeat-containing protein n=1 Tax=Ulvibacter litoralis TaxID=227084 RepID=A0A1G7GNV5_9FLAO|nr:hypothetical protein [Ulvibacter litoralis]GHC55583.1 hypothetical protein GCM10008083_19730 [Ulvibacter litoralis]SDE89804.1 hypothetical protein SAMN05421855_103250 [Ulvibacter litoralis]